MPVVKAQVSSALRVPEPAATRRAFLDGFAEPRFLHQVRECVGGRVAGADDLPDALGGALPARARVARALPRAGPRAPSTRRRHELEATLAALCGGPAPLTAHLEVETYTWGVLPDGPGGDDGLVEGLAAELAWTRDRLVALGAEEIR